MRRLSVLVMILAIVLLSGCFQVTRDNPFDPNSEGEKYMVSVYGMVYKGYSTDPVEGARVELDGKVYFTGSNGQYSFSVTPGNYSIKVTKGGFQTTKKIISVNAQPSQEENTRIFVFFDDFSEYNLNGNPDNPPWQLSIGSNGEIGMIDNSVYDGAQCFYLDTLYTNDVMNYAYTFTSCDLASAGQVNHIIVEITFRSGCQNQIMGFNISDDNIGQFFRIYIRDNSAYYSTPAYAVETLIASTFDVYDYPVIIKVDINELDRSSGYLTITMPGQTFQQGIDFDNSFSVNLLNNIFFFGESRDYATTPLKAAFEINRVAVY